VRNKPHPSGALPKAKHLFDKRQAARRKAEALKPRAPIPSMAVREQRELSWMLYITEAYIGNTLRALTVNAFTLDRSSLELMQKAVDRATLTANDLRAAMRRIGR